MGEKKPIDHPDYVMFERGGQKCINMSKWRKENVPQPPPKFKEGDNVIFTIETTITNVGQDCDGTVLYGADYIGNCWGEGCFKEAT